MRRAWASGSRLVLTTDVTYRKDDKDAGVTRFGFVIEDIDDVAERNHREKLTAASHQVKAAQFDPLRRPAETPQTKPAAEMKAAVKPPPAQKVQQSRRENRDR